jgi:pimeloyl-ACP methyl ester carboxylesterase
MNIRLFVTCAAMLSVFGCTPEDGSRRLDDDFGPKPLFDPVVLPSSLTGSAILPVPIDLLFGSDPGSDENRDNDADGTLAPAGALAGIPGWGLADGWSTTATLFFNVQGKVDVANAADGIRIFDSKRARELQPGVDFRVTASPVSALSPRLVVHWLKPLQESTRYLIGITTELRSPAGGAALVNELFASLRSETPFSQQTTNSQLGILALREPAKIPILERIQTTYLLPIIAGLQQLSELGSGSRGQIQREDLVLAWSFTTQSITPTLTALNAAATAHSLQVGASGLNLGQALSGNPAQPVPLPPGYNPDVYVGAFTLPYYHEAGADKINTSTWSNDGSISPNTVHPALGAPCNQLLRPISTTICYPIPEERSEQTVPVVLTRPEGGMPAGGWPVVVFLHGITGNRSQMFGIAGTLAAAGFVGIAIDQPLHGLPPGNPLRVPGTTERTFDADLDADNVVDASGAYFVNLASPITSRDNLRQSVIDQINLVKSLGGLQGLGPTLNETINTSRIYFLGHSLGGIVGGTLLGANSDIKAATLAMPGGGIAKLLDASVTFGPRIEAGLAASSVNKGTDTYEMFLRFAQLAIDPGDPINWATLASQNRAVLVIEVLGDSVVPNTATDTTQVIIPGFLSGTEPLALALGLSPVAVSAPVTEPQFLSGSQWLQFDAGNHGSILQPSTPNPSDDPVFVEMQRQVANFLASNGACLPLGGNCPQP